MSPLGLWMSYDFVFVGSGMTPKTQLGASHLYGSFRTNKKNLMEHDENYFTFRES